MDAVAHAESATNDMLIGPDWAVNMELCDIINRDPTQVTNTLKLLIKRMENKNPEVQLLALTVLETLSKNCGEVVHCQIIECDVLNEMVKIIHRKPDLKVREKILSLVNEWQDAFGGAGGRYPQYYYAYRGLRDAGFDFPPRNESAVSLFTPPRSHLINQLGTNLTPSYGGSAVRPHIQSISNATSLSLNDIQSARGIVDLLSEILNAVDKRNPNSVNEEVTVDLVGQCRSYQRQIMDLVNSTSDEGLLFQSLALNDDLQRVLQHYDSMVKIPSLVDGTMVSSSPPRSMNRGTFPTGRSSGLPQGSFVNVDQEDDDGSEDDEFSALARRFTKDDTKSKNLQHSTAKLSHPGRLLPPPPPSKNPVIAEASNANAVDFLSGDMIRTEGGALHDSAPNSLEASLVTKNVDASISNQSGRLHDDFMNLITPASFFEPSNMGSEAKSLPLFDNPSGQVADDLKGLGAIPSFSSPVPNNESFVTVPSSGVLSYQDISTAAAEPESESSVPSKTTGEPPQSSLHGLSHQFLKQTWLSSGGLDIGLSQQVNNLSLTPQNATADARGPDPLSIHDASASTKPAKPEDDTFKDLLDLAKARASTSSKPQGGS